MNKKIIKIIFFSVLIVLFIIVGIYFFKLKSVYKDVPKNYISVFHGGAGEEYYETYIYKIDNGKPNYGFKYINVTCNTSSYGSSESVCRITDDGNFDWTDGAFSVAKKNNAYSYVSIPNSDKTYTIEEYQNMFLMN